MVIEQEQHIKRHLIALRRRFLSSRVLEKSTKETPTLALKLKFPPKNPLLFVLKPLCSKSVPNPGRIKRLAVRRRVRPAPGGGVLNPAPVLSEDTDEEFLSPDQQKHQALFPVCEFPNKCGSVLRAFNTRWQEAKRGTCFKAVT